MIIVKKVLYTCRLLMWLRHPIKVSIKLLFLSFQRGTEKYHEKSDMAAGKGKWGVAYYKQDYPERDLDDDVVRAPYPLASFFHTHKCTHTHY